MKIFRYIFSAACAFLLLACSGQTDDSALPVLTASDTEIDLASEVSVSFTVTYNGTDVTSESVISCTSSDDIEVQDNIFSPQQEGTYSFVAQYNGVQSAALQINVVLSSSEPVESEYERHVSVMEFTGSWCINCPEGYDNMRGILAYPKLAAYKDKIHICAFHSDVDGQDTLAISQTQDVIGLFSNMAYPSFAVDLRTSGILTDSGVSLFRPSIEASFTEYLPHCGVAVSSVIDESGGRADVTVKVTSEKTDVYRVVVLVVQDKIKGWQKTVNYPEGIDDYLHRHVVRKVVTSYADTFTGEKITDTGTINAGSEETGTWAVEIDSRWVLENTEIYALVLDSDGYVNNMNVCAIDGGDSGYDIK